MNAQRRHYGCVKRLAAWLVLGAGGVLFVAWMVNHL